MYKKGQKLICTNDKGWADVHTGELCTGPKKDEVVTYLWDEPGIAIKQRL